MATGWQQRRIIREPVLLAEQSRTTLKIDFKKMSFHPGVRKNKWDEKIACTSSIALLKVCWGQGKNESVWCPGAMSAEKGR